jgi:xylan 1,4-beta-xylosidase
VRAPRPDTYSFWGHLLAFDMAVPLRWRVDAGAWSVADKTLTEAASVITQPGLRYAWYRLGRFPLETGWHTIEVEAVNLPGQVAVAGLDAFALTTGASQPLLVGAGWKEAQVLPLTVSLSADLAAPPTRWPRLHRGLAQGGEHPDPDYLARVAPHLRALGTDYVRLDHVFDYYDVVQRDRRGRLTFDFSKLDRALDAVLASGAQPFLSLGLTPAVLSPTGSETMPPTDLKEWRELVMATVRHVNVERGLKVRYWEVWNEPNLPSFWKGSFQDYTRLYQATAAAIVAVDPTVKVGGPATAGHEGWVPSLIDFAAATGTRLDFVSWHNYHVRPVMLANQVTLIRRYLERYPAFRDTELIVSEWNLHSDFGERANFVSDSHHTAAFAAAALQALTDAGLDRALFFEAVDGRPPDGRVTWGRWGALTYDGQPKPVYHALHAFSRLHDLRVPASSDDPRVGVLVTRQDNRVALLIWRLAPVGQAAQPVRLTLRHPPAHVTSLRRWTVDATHSRLGGTLEEVAPVTGALAADGTWTATLTLTPDSVNLLTWEP